MKNYSNIPLKDDVKLDSEEFKNWFVKDGYIHQDERKRSIAFHIQSDDYFVTLATVLSLAAQDLRSGNLTIEKAEVLMDNLKNDLLFLQAYFKICEREGK